MSTLNLTFNCNSVLQGAYTAEAWKTLVNNPVNRTEAICPAVEKLGGKRGLPALRTVLTRCRTWHSLPASQHCSRAGLAETALALASLL